MVWYGMVWYGMVEVCEGAPVAVSGWVLTDRHDLAPRVFSVVLLRTLYISDLLILRQHSINSKCLSPINVTRRCHSAVDVRYAGLALA